MIRLWKTYSNGKGQKNFIAGTNQGGLTDVENKIKLLTVTHLARVEGKVM